MATQGEGLRRLSEGQSDFARIREDGRIYVDKSDLIWELAHDKDYAFLSRPRRFGKSLLVSTLEAYFQGKRELFRGLKIERLEQDWVVYPVLRLDMSVGASSYDTLCDQLSYQLAQWEGEYISPDEPRSTSLGTRFLAVVRAAYRKTGQRAVVLVDEYDSPLQASVLDHEEHEKIRSLYRDFFAVLKSEAGSIRFCFLTGIAKFTQLSIFSVLNNLSNISFSPKYQAICGISERELVATYEPEIQNLARSLDTSVSGALDQLRSMYDGYLFCPHGERLYNPYSVVNALADGAIRSYWYSSGQSSILSRMLGEVWHELPELEGSRISIDELEMSDFSLDNPQVLLYQLGYLTIDYVDEVAEEYILRFPNAEVRDALYKAVLPSVTHLAPRQASSELRAFRRPLLQESPNVGDVEASFKAFTSVFVSMPYSTGGAASRSYERDAQLVLVTLAGAAGFGVSAERHSLGGRADVVITTRSCVVVVELKMDDQGGLAAAKAQFTDHGYSEPYKASGKRVFEVAVELSRVESGVKAFEVTQVA